MTCWSDEFRKRREAKKGDLFYMGRTNFGQDKLVLPVIRKTKTQLICSDGTRTERIMIGTGHVVGRAMDKAQSVDNEDIL